MRHNLQLHMLASPADEQGLAIHTQACLRTRFHSKRISRAGGLGIIETSSGETANCQAEMKDGKAARRSIEELMKAYPGSEAAQAGKERLASIK